MIAIERTLTQDEFDRFARLSGDDNPIHVDAAFSARTRFGRTVAHGVFLTMILRSLAAQLAPGAALSAQAAQFPAPTFAGEPMRFSAEASSADIVARATRIADGETTCIVHFSLAPAS